MLVCSNRINFNFSTDPIGATVTIVWNYKTPSYSTTQTLTSVTNSVISLVPSPMPDTDRYAQKGIYWVKIIFSKQDYVDSVIQKGFRCGYTYTVSRKLKLNYPKLTVNAPSGNRIYIMKKSNTDIQKRMLPGKQYKIKEPDEYLIRVQPVDTVNYSHNMYYLNTTYGKVDVINAEPYKYTYKDAPWYVKDYKYIYVSDDIDPAKLQSDLQPAFDLFSKYWPDVTFTYDGNRDYKWYITEFGGGVNIPVSATKGYIIIRSYNDPRFYNAPGGMGWGAGCYVTYRPDRLPSIRDKTFCTSLIHELTHAGGRYSRDDCSLHYKDFFTWLQTHYYEYPELVDDYDKPDIEELLKKDVSEITDICLIDCDINWYCSSVTLPKFNQCFQIYLVQLLYGDLIRRTVPTF